MAGAVVGRREGRRPGGADEAADAWELRLTAPNDFVAAWVRDRLRQPILQAAAAVRGVAPALTVQAAAASAKSPACRSR